MLRKERDNEPNLSLDPHSDEWSMEDDHSHNRHSLGLMATEHGDGVGTGQVHMKTRVQMPTRRGSPWGDCESCTT
jgi:hypothetical protein